MPSITDALQESFEKKNFKSKYLFAIGNSKRSYTLSLIVEILIWQQRND